jgi:hypothetical protein
MLTTLIAPEVVLYIAITQFAHAPYLCNQLNEIATSQPQLVTETPRSAGAPESTDSTDTEAQDHSRSSKIPTFSLTYGYSAIVGGFVFNVSSFCDEANRVTLSYKIILRLARRGRYLSLGEAAISDKSKANVLGKDLACLHICWMLVQRAARKVSGYPLTLLEIHTFVHVVCAVALYGSGSWSSGPSVILVFSANISILETSGCD